MFGGWWNFAFMPAILTLAIATNFFVPDPRTSTSVTRDRHLSEG